MRRIFLLPGLCGDDRYLVAFRDGLAGQLHLDLVDFPDSGRPGAVLSNMQALAAIVAAEISTRQPSGEIELLGFSFGGSAALEVAAQLEEAGRRISFLGIIDGPFQMEELQGWFALFRHATTARGAAKMLVQASTNVDVTRRLVWASVAPQTLGKQSSDPVRRAMLAHLRRKALQTWTPRRTRAPGILVRTAEFGPANRERWRTLCPNLAIVEVPGRHEELLHDQSRDQIAGILVDALTPVQAVG